MPPPSAVLDTNTVLDWLVFRDPATAELARCIEAGRLAWRATPAMRLEFERVLPRPSLARWAPDAAHAATAWDRLARLEPFEPARQPRPSVAGPPPLQAREGTTPVSARAAIEGSSS